MIEAIARPARASDLDDLARLLVDAVQSGASISFMSPFSVSEAREWWRQTFDQSSPRAIVLVAGDELGIAGSVSLNPAWPPDQPHRADISKLLVHRRARRQGSAAR